MKINKRLKVKHKKGAIGKVDFTKLEEIMKERGQE